MRDPITPGPVSKSEETQYNFAIEEYTRPFSSTATSVADGGLNDFINNHDTIFTAMWRNVQFVTQNDSFIVATPTAHEIFLLSFIVGSAISLAQLVLTALGIQRRAAKDAEIRKQATPLISSVEHIKIYAEAYIRDPENKYLSTLAFLIHDEKNKRFFIAKKVVETQLTDEEILSAKQSLSNQYLKLQETNALPSAKKFWQEFSFMSFAKDTIEFFFKMSLWYWILWIMAAGFVGFPAATFISFSNPVLVFVLPVVLTLIEYGIKWYVASRNNYNATDSNLNALVDSLLKIKLAAAETAKTASTISEMPDLAALDAWARSTKDAKLIKIANEAQIHEHSKTGRRTRVIVKTVSTAIMFFIMLSFLAWPLSDLLATFHITAGALFGAGAAASAVSLLVVPLAISILVGIAYGVKTYYDANKKEDELAKVFDSSTFKEMQNELDALKKEVQLRRAYLKAKGVENVTRTASMENPSFVDHLELTPQSADESRWNQFTQWLKPIYVVVNQLGTGTLIARIFIGLVAALAQIGLAANFSMLSAAVIVPIVLVSILWAGFSLFQYYQERNLHSLEARVKNISTELEVYRQENEWLKRLDPQAQTSTAHTSEYVESVASSVSISPAATPGSVPLPASPDLSVANPLLEQVPDAAPAATAVSASGVVPVSIPAPAPASAPNPQADDPIAVIAGPAVVVVPDDESNHVPVTSPLPPSPPPISPVAVSEAGGKEGGEGEGEGEGEGTGSSPLHR